MPLAPYMSCFIFYQIRGVFRHSLLMLWDKKVCLIYRALKFICRLFCALPTLERYQSQSGDFSPRVNILETFKARPILYRMVKVPYPGVTDSSASPTLGT